MLAMCMWCVMCTCRRCVCGPWPCSERKSCQLCPGAVGQPCLPEDTCIYVLGSSPHLCSLKYLTQKTSTELLAPPSRTRASKHRPVPRRACLLGAPGLVARVSTRSSHGQSRSVRRGPGPRCVHACVYLCVCVCWLLAGTSCWREREAKGHTAEEVATSSPLHTSRHPGHPFWVTNWQRGRVTVPHTSSRVLLGLAQPTKHPSLPPHRELTPARCPRSPGLKT